MPRFRTLLSLLLLTAVGFAQTKPADLPADLSIGHGCALDVVDGTLTAIGDDYKATFRDGELAFTPLLGRAAPRNLPFALQVTHIGRSELTAVGPATAEPGELVVNVARPQLVERIEVRPEGLKQSYVFTQLPPGDGDLVVRSRLRSELRPLATQSSGSLKFLFGDVGGVEVGQVLGIDADGRTVSGTLRIDGEHLDIVLPAAFVRDAKLPLVVDPLLSAVVVTSSTLPDSAPDIAPLPAPIDAYLVVWLRAVSATDNDVRGQRVTSNATVTGSLLMLETSTASAGKVTIAASPTTATWLVVFDVGGDVKARFISSTGVLQNTTDIANGPDQQQSPCLAGGTLNALPAAVCVWRDVTTNQILTKRLDMAAQNSLFPAHVIASGTILTTVSDPTISRDNRSESLLVAWTVTNQLAQKSLRGMVIDLDANPRSASFAIAGSGTNDAFAPTCAADGDGENFLVAYRTSSPVFGTGSACIPVQFSFAGAGIGPVAVGTTRSITGPNGPARSAAVAMFQGSAVVACATVGSTGHDVLALSVDPLIGSDCEGSLVVDTAGNDTGVGICSRAFGPSLTSPNDGALVYVPQVSGQGDISLRLLRADDGVRAELDIACTAGEVLAPCGRAGNANFGAALHDAAANELTLVIHSLGLLNFPCGPCLIGPDPSLGVVSFLGTTSATGGIRAPLPLPGGPAAIGATIHSQFVLFGGPCLGNFRATEGVSSTLQ